MDANGFDHRTGGTRLTGSSAMRHPTRFEAPRLVTTSVGRISRSTAEASAIEGAIAQGRAEMEAEMAADVNAAIQHHRVAAERMSRTAKALAAALDQIEHKDLGTLHDLEGQVLTLAVAMAQEIVGRELDLSNDVAVASAARALAMTPDRGDVVLRVHPSDLAAVLESAAVMGHRAGDVRIVADDSVSSGGCVAVMGALVVDAQIDSVFARIREAFAS